jgi:hypothetical protein
MSKVIVNVKIDSTDFKRGLERNRKLVMQAARKGIGKAGVMLLDDSVQGLPQAPLYTSNLRASAAVFVQNRLFDTSKHAEPSRQYLKPERKIGSDTPTVSTEPLQPNAVIGLVVFNAPYAAQWHETLPLSGKFSHGPAGIKWMEKKIIEKGKEYIDVVAKEIKKVNV